MKNLNEKWQISWLFNESRGVLKHLIVQAMSGIALQLAYVIMTAFVVVEIVNVITGEGNYTVATLAWVFALMLAISIIAQRLFDVTDAKVAQQLWRNSRQRIFRAFYSRKYALLQKHHSVELQMLLNDDSSNTSDAFANIYTHFLTDIAIGVSAFIAIFRSSWQVAFIMLGAAIGLAMVYRLLALGMQKATIAKQKAEEAVRLNLQEGVTKVPLFKAYRMVDRFVAEHERLYKAKLDTAVATAKVTSLYNITSISMTFFNYLIIYAFGGYFVYLGHLTIGELIGMGLLIHMFSSPVFKLGAYVRMLAAASASAKRIRAITELPAEEAGESIALGAIQSLDVNNLNFAYEDTDILKGVSLNAQPGDIVGVIGESGSGKSTLTKILMGFYAPKSGTVQLTDQHNQSTHNMRDHIAYVPSSDFLFTATVKENICMANPVSEGDMIRAAKAAGVHDFIESLPEKYDTIIGEGGLNGLSSGQGQRVGIARALYANKPILIFDEPTSNLDVVAIENLHSTIKNISRGKICLIVTHDLATKDICNKVYTINKGTMVAA